MFHGATRRFNTLQRRPPKPFENVLYSGTMGVVTEPPFELTEFHGMLTSSAPMRALFDLLGRVARTEASILLRGETGVGKELAAHAIHRLSRRSAGPFRAINCATLTPDPVSYTHLTLPTTPYV